MILRNRHANPRQGRGRYTRQRWERRRPHRRRRRHRTCPAFRCRIWPCRRWVDHRRPSDCRQAGSCPPDYPARSSHHWRWPPCPPPPCQPSAPRLQTSRDRLHGPRSTSQCQWPRRKAKRPPLRTARDLAPRSFASVTPALVQTWASGPVQLARNRRSMLAGAASPRFPEEHIETADPLQCKRFDPCPVRAARLIRHRAQLLEDRASARPTPPISARREWPTSAVWPFGPSCLRSSSPRACPRLRSVSRSAAMR